jgi:hypothetical protein
MVEIKYFTRKLKNRQNTGSTVPKASQSKEAAASIKILSAFQILHCLHYLRNSRATKWQSKISEKNGDLFPNLSFGLPRSPEVTLTFDLQPLNQRQSCAAYLDE